jgi:hypothetical protein
MTGGQSAVRMNDRHSFPVGGLVELSRATYQSTPLAVVEIRPTVFSFIGAGGTVNSSEALPPCSGSRAKVPHPIRRVPRT